MQKSAGKQVWNLISRWYLNEKCFLPSFLCLFDGKKTVFYENIATKDSSHHRIQDILRTPNSQAEAARKKSAISASVLAANKAINIKEVEEEKKNPARHTTNDDVHATNT